MIENQLPKLPEWARYGAEVVFSFSGKDEFNAPEGFAIKTLDPEKKYAVCVPIQVFNKELDTWVVIGQAE